MHQNMHQILEGFLGAKWSRNDPQMGGNKFGKFDFGRLGRLQGRPKPRIGPPEHSKWSPKHPQITQNGARETPRTSKKVPKRAQSTQNGTQAPPKNPKRRPSFQTIQKKRSRTNEHTHTHTQTQTQTYTHTRTQPHTQIDAKD